MRELTSHKVNGLNDSLLIKVLDEPGHGGACHNYKIEAVEKSNATAVGLITNESELKKAIDLADATCCIKFQNGPIAEVGINGISHESLLAIVQDRLKCFQSGDHACEENRRALLHLDLAVEFLHERTRKRIAREVEGTHAI